MASRRSRRAVVGSVLGAALVGCARAPPAGSTAPPAATPRPAAARARTPEPTAPPTAAPPVPTPTVASPGGAGHPSLLFSQESVAAYRAAATRYPTLDQ